MVTCNCRDMFRSYFRKCTWESIVIMHSKCCTTCAVQRMQTTREIWCKPNITFLWDFSCDFWELRRKLMVLHGHIVWEPFPNFLRIMANAPSYVYLWCFRAFLALRMFVVSFGDLFRLKLIKFTQELIEFSQISVKSVWFHRNNSTKTMNFRALF